MRYRSSRRNSPGLQDGEFSRDARTVLRVGQDFYILASALASRRTTRVVADGWSFAAFEGGGDILASPLEALGFFHRDTRYLSCFELKIAGESPYFLNSYLSDDNTQLRVNLTNPDLGIQGDAIELRRDCIQIERSWVLSDPVIFQRLVLRNYARSLVRLPLEFNFAVDFADLFEVRGVKRRRRGVVLPPTVGADKVTFMYRGLDEVERSTEICFDKPPQLLNQSRALFQVNLRPDAHLQLEVRISSDCSPPPAASRRPRFVRFTEALSSRREEVAELGVSFARVSASNELFDSLLRRSGADLISLISNRPEGTFIMAGIPWFATLFGRDSLITALSTLPFAPNLAGRTLRTLARLQGTEINERRDEQPGKIVHEIRSGEMAATAEVPFGRYYGSIDSTPLFLWLYGRYVATSGDLELASDLWPCVEQALAWLDKWGDRDGDGFVEYLRETPRGLTNQGWKDSLDAISHADGAIARPPIALCEVQGYVYAALSSVGQVALRLGFEGPGNRLLERASSLRQAFLRDFWLEAEGTLALALDAYKRPCRVMASNAAHCLAAGLLDAGRAEVLAKRLLADDMFSGWGIRTLSTNERRYNPMSYHNGSVWPHDNGMAALGLARIEGRQGVLSILEGLLHAGVQLNTGSLPELFCGFPREPRLGPVPYPVACHPQAWGAASVFMILQAMLGLQVNGSERRLVIDCPIMPAWLEWLSIEALPVGNAAVSFIVRRTPHGAMVEVIDKHGPVVLEVLK